jgi:N-acetylmuramoyl-L-alanine amidase CwlA
MSRWIGCPESNFRRGRPFGLRPEAVVVHIMDGSFAAGESVFRNPTNHKSAHYGISSDGVVHQYVDENDTAFHAGIVINPTWSLLKPRVNPNFYTIGVEHEGRPDDLWPEAQLSASAILIGQIAARWDIPLDDSHVIRHHQIRASKTCPGNWLQIGELLKRVPTPLALSAVTTSIQQSVVSGAGIISPAPSISSLTPVTSTASVGPASTVSPAAARMIVVRTLRNVNLRRARPATTAQVVRVIPGHTDVVVTKFEIGERVEGNIYWYVDVQGNYLWAGATNAPDPTVIAA